MSLWWKISAMRSSVITIAGNCLSGFGTAESCMLLWSDNPKEFSQEIQVICREIQKTVKEAMQLSVSIGIGFCVEKLEELPKSYESAVATLKYRYTKGSGQVYDCESPMSCGNLLELEQDFKDIEEAAKNQQSEELMDILDHVENGSVMDM